MKVLHSNLFYVCVEEVYIPVAVYERKIYSCFFQTSMCVCPLLVNFHFPSTDKAKEKVL